jgi:hypothetical protein
VRIDRRRIRRQLKAIVRFAAVAEQQHERREKRKCDHR